MVQANMAAAIVYDGVGGGGSLFAGMKFFFTQRVPSRPRWMDIVTANGGEIVKLDKQAQVIIADHAYKGSPPGSVSWKYIDISAKNGILENLEDYQIGPSARVIREPGSSQPSKSGRTPFTAADDRFLTEWVVRAERKGIAVKGNELYRQLEMKNNRHTLQSWRDRWIKYLSHLPRPNLHDDAPLSPNESPAPRAGLRQARPQQSGRETAPKSPSVSRASPGRPYVTISTGGNNFTEEEKQLVLNCVEDMLNIDDDKVIDAWAAWATEYPNHTAQEWRNYFVKNFQPPPRESIPMAEEEISQPSELRRPSDITPKGRSPEHASSNPPAKSDSDATVSQIARPREAGLVSMNEKTFKDRLLVLAESLGVEVDFNPVICGRHIPLFKIWQVVMSDAFRGYEVVEGRRLWLNVARTLNFNEFRDASAPSQLRACYREILVDFEEARNDYIVAYQSLTGSQEEALIESQFRQTATYEAHILDENPPEVSEGEEFDDDLDPILPVAALPPSRKRRFETERSYRSESPIKRNRIDKGKGRELEIPSTPDEAINSSKTMHPSYLMSPSENPLLDPDEDNDEEELFVRPHGRSIFSRSKSNRQPMQHIADPETQDFRYFSPDLDDARSFSSLPSPKPQGMRNRTGEDAGQASLREAYSTQSQTDSQREAELQAFIDHHVSLGCPQDIVVEALTATTMETGDAGVVMEAILQTGQIPAEIQGVWTKEDDEALEDEESEEFERICVKHGKRRVATRLQFIADVKEARQEQSSIATGASFYPS